MIVCTYGRASMQSLYSVLKIAFKPFLHARIYTANRHKPLFDRCVPTQNSNNRATSAVKDAAADSQNQRDNRVVDSVNRLLRYCRIADSGLEIEHKLAQHLKENVFNTYMASRSTATEEEAAAAQADSELLRTVLDFHESA
jgi:hypothetical protein